MMLWITTFLSVIAPLVLIYLWISYSFVYVKKYRPLFSFGKWVFGKSNLDPNNFNAILILSYQRIYSLMLGFGMAILAHAFASMRFMLTKFDEMETAMIQYIRFPLLVLQEFGLINSGRELTIQSEEFSDEMLLIVVISGMFFLIGYLLGSLIIDLRFKLFSKYDQHPPKKISKVKDMFYLKTKRRDKPLT